MHQSSCNIALAWFVFLVQQNSLQYKQIEAKKKESVSFMLEWSLSSWIHFDRIGIVCKFCIQFSTIDKQIFFLMYDCINVNNAILEALHIPLWLYSIIIPYVSMFMM